MSRFAILQMSDTPQIESTAVMLRAAGYSVRVCGKALRDRLQQAGLDTVLSVESMVNLGYDPLDRNIPEATPADLDRCDLFVEIKVRNVPRLWDRWPRLKGKTLYWRVNGSRAEVCPRGGDEFNLPCPVATACLWYALDPWSADHNDLHERSARAFTDTGSCRTLYGAPPRGPSWGGMAYTFWPPYPRSAEYDAVDRLSLTSYSPPFCVCHKVRAWGYGTIVSECVDLGVKCYGNGSPAGQISHRDVVGLCREGLCLVHLKSVDCPGWALYEAMLSGVPVVTGRLLRSRMRADDLLEHGETCLEFGVEGDKTGRGDMDFPRCLREITEALIRLRDPAENRRIGENGRKRLNELLWSEAKDGDGFRAFMKGHFG